MLQTGDVEFTPKPFRAVSHADESYAMAAAKARRPRHPASVIRDRELQLSTVPLEHEMDDRSISVTVDVYERFLPDAQ